MIGSTFAQYEITGHLGTGGMGEVYQATDARLGRSVAIKLLPAALAQDGERTARLEREARILASLNHPHIAAIYGLEDHSGRTFLVMELVPGETLAERIARGPVAVGDALSIAIQIAQALEAAHEKGVMHRDLKPANIKVTPSGQVKVLDFGLAKAFAGEATAVNALNSPTMSAGATSAGVILGTAAYMSPEQARGQEVDHRTDLFAFGCVLYEMLTGQPAFPGEGVSETMASILRSEPDWGRLPVDTPAAIRRLLRRCLRKERHRRLQTAGDARIEIEDASTEPEPGGSAEYTALARRHILKWIAAGGAGAVTGALGALYFDAFRSPIRPADPPPKFLIYPPGKAAVFNGPINVTVGIPQLAVSPDGRALAFVASLPGAKPNLWIRDFDNVDPRPLSGTEGAESPFWNPDSTWVGFFAEGKLKKVPASGGAVRVLNEDIVDSRGGSWGGNTILIGTGGSSIYSVSAEGGPLMPVTTLEAKDGSHRWPHFLPDGRHFLFTIRSELADHRGLYAGSLDGMPPKLLVSGFDPNGLYTPGYLLFTQGDTVVGQEFDPDALRPIGQSFTVVEKIGRSTTGYGSVSISRSGVMAYAGASVQPGRLTWFDHKGNPRGFLGADGDYTDFRFNSKETRLALSLVDSTSGSPQIWMMDLTRDNITSPFTDKGSWLNAGPVFCPDDSHVIFRTTRRGGTLEFYQRSSAGGGREEPLVTAEMHRQAGARSINTSAADCSPDGLELLYFNNGSYGWQLYRLPFADRKPVLLAEKLRANGVHASFSPDGHFIAYSSDHSEQMEVYVQTYPALTEPIKISSRGGYEAQWGFKGNELYFLSLERELMAVSISPGPKFGTPKRLFQTRVASGINAYRKHYVPSRDGERFLINTPTGDSDPSPIVVLWNWRSAGQR